VQGGFFLGKKPLGRSGFGVQQLENSYSRGFLLLLSGGRGQSQVTSVAFELNCLLCREPRRTDESPNPTWNCARTACTYLLHPERNLGNIHQVVFHISETTKY
jgi:hypothetical protein